MVRSVPMERNCQTVRYALTAGEKRFILETDCEGKLLKLIFVDNAEKTECFAGLPSPCGVAYEAQTQLDEYFKGKCRMFSLPLNPEGTPFQKRVWDNLLKIPYGSAVSYKTLAQSLGMTNGARAVGGAVGKNPLPIFIPCHRVLAAHGAIGGFALGLPLKKELLALEGLKISSNGNYIFS